MSYTRHFSLSPPWAYSGGTQRYVMFSFFSFRDGKLNIGQCQTVKEQDVPIELEWLAKGGWTPARYKYVNGKAILVDE